MNITEFSIAGETCTAAMTSNLEFGECYGGPISVGYYSQVECWIKHEGHTINIQTVDVNDFCKQLKRAARIAKDIGGAA